jgi:Transposase IS66 family.
VLELEKKLAELQDRLRANSSNSSTAPSASPPWAPKLKKKPTGKPPGGQKGHQGHYRKLLAIEQVDEVVKHVPVICNHCQAPLMQEPQLRARHQIAELPPRAVKLIEHQSYACTCSGCGQRTIQPIPPAIKSRCTGERLDAAVCYLSARVHGSRRAVEEVLSEIFGIPLSLGSISARECEITAALAQSYQQVQRHVRAAAAKNVDETGWKRTGRWLWVAASKTAALFHIDRGRNWHAMQQVLGQTLSGTICTDRFSLYNYIKLHRRAICWAHLKRDFVRWTERGKEGVAFGEKGLALVKQVTRLWNQFQNRRFGRQRLKRKLRPLRKRLDKLLSWGMRCRIDKIKHFCRNLLRVKQALWTFARVRGIEPTNNHAERCLRPAVIWRKKSLGCHSQAGCRYVERMLSVIQTLRLQKRSVMQYLTQSLQAHRHCLPSPMLV